MKKLSKMAKNKHRIFHNLKQIAFLYNVSFLLWWQKFNTEEKKYLRLPKKEKKALLERKPEIKEELFQKFTPQKREKLLKKTVKNQHFIRRQKNRTWVGGRGSAKTNTIGKLIKQMFMEMPQGIIGLGALTFTHIEANILPEVFFAFSMEKIVEGKHFVYGKQPPKHWKKPLRQIKDYSHVISFNNGFCIALLSELRQNVNRGISLDALIVDEAGFAKKEWITKVLLPTVRANKYAHFAKSPVHWGTFFFTSAPDTLAGQWIYENERLSKENKDKYFYIESTPYDNLDALPDDYIEELQRRLTKLEFDIEVMNKRLKKPQNAFYTFYDEDRHRHDPYGYKEGNNKDGKLIQTFLDYSPNKPLEISLDHNTNFSSMSISQIFGKDCWFNNVLWVKWQTIYELIDKFNEHYKDHQKRILHLYGDRSLYKTDRAMKVRYIDTIIKKLAKAGWIVVNKVSAPILEHEIKHLVINRGLKEQTPGVPKIRINQTTCRALHLSILNAPILPNFEKDKGSERDKNLEQELATHLSDCFDYRVYPLLVGPVLRAGNGQKRNSETTFS